jgi:hypothetical protein
MGWTLDVDIVPAILVKSNLVGSATDAIGKIISSYFRAYVECPNLISYAFCTSIRSQGGPELRVGLKIKLGNSELDWISTLMFESPCYPAPSLCPVHSPHHLHGS